MNTRKTNLTALMINLTVVIITAYSVAHNFRTDVVRDIKSVNGSALSDFTGLASFRYFTTLSNAFAAVAAAIMLVFNVKNAAGNNYYVPKWALVIKYVATCAVALTFTTVALFLSPVLTTLGQSYFTLFSGNGFFLHFLIPVLCIVNFIFFENHPDLHFNYAYLALLPTVLYAAVYAIKVAILKDWPDFYSFSPTGNGKALPLMIVAMCGLSFIVSTAVYVIRKKTGLKY